MRGMKRIQSNEYSVSANEHYVSCKMTRRGGALVGLGMSMMVIRCKLNHRSGVIFLQSD